MTLPSSPPAPHRPAVEGAFAPRKIIHVDMDAFYASVEQRDDPALRGRPVAVGGSRQRGVVAAASYEARRFGVRSAMSSMAALRRCPELVFVRPRFEAYKAISQQIRSIFADHTALIEPLSLDEAYLDVTAAAGSATGIAAAIRARILADTGLTASAGVSYNKFLAKLASDHRKPDGLTVIAPGRGEAFVEGLDIARFHGVGPVTAARMKDLGIATGADLRARSSEELDALFGKAGRYYYWAARGVDHRPVRPDRVRRSSGSEHTFAEDLTTETELIAGLAPAVAAVWRHCEASGTLGRTVTLKVKYADFRQITRSRTGAEPVASRDALDAIGRDLVRGVMPLRAGVRLIGLALSGFSAEAATDRQLALAL
ncbi:DNA polymerase IV [Lichenibacterium minor]|uniref:DNA polymerase IV n=1 Tax=Lichenibacterium minor TaxID=2316528 RepID=A0A4Q2U6J2_9HYPH|nr:DNA polymerase IV [Lichenibacterium minor]